MLDVTRALKSDNTPRADESYQYHEPCLSQQACAVSSEISSRISYWNVEGAYSNLSSPLSFMNYLAHLNCPTAGDSNFIKINTLNSLKNPAYPQLSTGVVPRRFLGPFVVALTDLPSRAPTVINKIINYCIVLYCSYGMYSGCIIFPKSSSRPRI
jgi:hypothetical protein